jgi:hypothetical protein
LSPYFEGLHVLSEGTARQVQGSGEFVHVPLRSFRPDCLLTHGGDSVLERLINDCSLLVIQDADMRASDIIAHRKFIRSSDVVAIDSTKALRLRGHFSYVLGRADDQALITLAGEKLW